jgi:hypothetical protein
LQTGQSIFLPQLDIQLDSKPSKKVFLPEGSESAEARYLHPEVFNSYSEAVGTTKKIAES